jgi:putative ABC transport system ATP-binding protein
MIGCLLKPSSGSIKIMDNDVTRLKQKDLSLFRLRNIGFIFQSFRLLDSLTVSENVELVLDLNGYKKDASKNKVNRILQEIGIDHKAASYPGVLSGGEKQRAAIARALVNDPGFILADEPTGSLDSNSGKKVIEVLCNIAQLKSKTVIIVSHDPRIQHYAHRIFFMEDGHIVENKKYS